MPIVNISSHFITHHLFQYIKVVTNKNTLKNDSVSNSNHSKIAEKIVDNCKRLVRFLHRVYLFLFFENTKKLNRNETIHNTF